MSTKLKKSELVVEHKVAYKRGNQYSLATIMEIKKRIKIDDEGEERWVTPESLHSLNRLKSGEKGANYSTMLTVALSAKSVTTDAVQPLLQQFGLSPKIASMVAVGIVFVIGLLFSFVTTGEFSLPTETSNETTSEVVTSSEADKPDSSDSTSEFSAPVASSVTGDWYELYFTTPIYPDKPENRPAEVPIMEALIAAIDSAQETLEIAIYELNLPEIGDAILAAKDRGVVVRLVTDTDEIDHLEVLIELNEKGVPMVEDDRSAIMHNKFVVVDGKAVWTGSWNFTPNGTFRNNNNGIYVKSPELAALYQIEFEELFSGSFGPRSETNPNKQVQINDTLLEICFAPEDDCADRLTAFINEAQVSIHVLAFSFTHDEMGQAIVKRGQDGVQVRAIFEIRGANTEYSELGRFQDAGFDAVTDGNPYTYHHKVIVVDGKKVALGSFNFSNNADRSNDENLLIIDNVDIAAEYVKEFERNYEQVLNPPNK
ncbi:phospholipase D-like domain-containing protein [Anaerolineales bacterium HSG6]|nr:phospholipase D-like domain-containing protein [Anaerolineales bacterium HSG6]MDM8532045.1 phospholipase D-like domain-containing protein [Anaerolineales bacterium HSG25]